VEILSDIGWIRALDVNMVFLLNTISFWSLVAALSSAGLIITFVTIKE